MPKHISQISWTPHKLERWIKETDSLLAEIPEPVDFRLDGIRSLAGYAWFLMQHRKRPSVTSAKKKASKKRSPMSGSTSRRSKRNNDTFFVPSTATQSE